MSKVTCIVPNYNHARFLPERLDSILAQTRMPDEIILLDDQSSDNSCEILQEYAERFPDLITCHFNEENSGTPFAQWKKGVDLASGEFIWLAESDDVADPRFLETLVPMLEVDPKVGVAYCQSHMIDEEGSNLGDMHFWTDALDAERWKSCYTHAGNEECARYLSNRNTIPNASAVLFRKSAYACVGDLPLSFRLCGDWLVWVTILRDYSVTYTPEMLNAFRQHDVSVRAKTRYVKFRAESWCIMQHIMHEFHVSSAARAKILTQQLSIIGKDMEVELVALEPQVVIEDYKENLEELFAQLSVKLKRQYVENTNVFLPLARQLADYGNKLYTNKSFYLARQFYLESHHYQPFSIRMILNIATTYFPSLRIFAKKLVGD